MQLQRLARDFDTLFDEVIDVEARIPLPLPFIQRLRRGATSEVLRIGPHTNLQSS
jgi:hypothetical protein